DLLGVRLGQRAAEHREVLAEDEHQSAVDGAVAGNHAVAGHAVFGHSEIVAAVLDEDVPFLEAAVVEQDVDALAGGQLALGVLGRDALLAAAQLGARAPLLEFFYDLVHGARLVRCKGSGSGWTNISRRTCGSASGPRRPRGECWSRGRRPRPRRGPRASRSRAAESPRPGPR